ncbi:MAG: glycoside hydrolase family 38 C-terminal domain-containing protein [Clostridia bacterium]
MPYNYKAMRKRIKKTYAEIESHIYNKLGVLEAEAWITGEPVSFPDRMTGEKVRLNRGDNWGGLFDCAWFNFKGVIPSQYIGRDIVFIIDISGEACIFGKDGEPLQGITTAASMFDRTLGKPGKKVVESGKLIDGNGSVDFWADAGNNDLFGNQQNNGTLVEAYIAVRNNKIKKIYYDFEVLLEMLDIISENKAGHHTILYALYEASLVFDTYDDDEAETASEILQAEISRRSIDSPLSISAIGHSHIDLGWLWPIRETKRKAIRTFATVLLNMEKYPDYIFGASQSQLYQWIKDDYPQLYERIKLRIKEGRWEPQGAMWVEADTNITGGESLVRQILYGKKFFREEFGIEADTLWLPDVFGYSAAIPQILKKSDVDYFMTIKISWNDFNRFPHHTFFWQGIDGSRVLAHMPPEGTYNSSAAPRAAADAETNFSEKGISGECLLLFGIGDGGGGPGEEHLERLERIKNLQGLPPVKQGPSADFFKRISGDSPKLKTWVGELYLEHHRGTYTSEGRSKYYNRLLEKQLRDFEIISVMNGIEYDMGEVEEIWKEILLYQFHDILPGSSIKRVYDESIERYALLSSRLSLMTAEAAECPTDNVSECSVVNTLSRKRTGWVECNGIWKHIESEGISSSEVLFLESDEPETIYFLEDAIGNGFLEIRFNEDGNISSVYNKTACREYIAQGNAANVLSVFRDDGDAWDFPHDYKSCEAEKPGLISFRYGISGPEVWRENIYKFGNSLITQKIVLTDGGVRADVRNVIEWNDPGFMLRAGFPIAVSSGELTCGIQFGYIGRPSHENTSWDMAKFEVCAHNWVDISRGDFGFALLSDYKYGFSSGESFVDICLLRSTRYPDAAGDLGRHEFTYSLYPHQGGHIEGRVIEEGMDLQFPMYVFNTGHKKGNPGKLQFIRTDRENIMIETMKQAEDGKGIIIRLYESYGRETNATLTTAGTASSIYETNLIERNLSLICRDTNEAALCFKPFEIKTIRVESI